MSNYNEIQKVEQAIVLAIQDVYGLNVEQVFNGTRTRFLFDIRAMAYYILREKTKRPYSDLMKCFGGVKNRVTVMYGVKAAEGNLRVGFYKKEYRHFLDVVNAKLNAQ